MPDKIRAKLSVPDVVFLMPTLDGGVGLVTSRLAVGMQKRGLGVEIWSLTGGAYAAESEITVTVRYLEPKQASMSLFPLVKLLKTHGPKTLLSASYHMNCVAVIARMIAGSKTRLVLVEHTSLTNGLATISVTKRFIAKIGIRLFYRYADAWIAVSKDAAAQMADYAGLKAEQVKVIYNPVLTPDIFTKSRDQVAHLFFELDEPILLAVGRMTSEKDYPTMLKAVAAAREKQPVRLIVLGDGPDKSKLEKLAQELSITDCVSFVGQVDNPYPYYTHADGFVLSSAREGLPTVLIEALAFGLPVVSTDARSGPREILNDGEYGTLVPVGNHKKLAEAILSTLNSPRPKIPEGVLKQYQSDTAVNAYTKVLFPISTN